MIAQELNNHLKMLYLKIKVLFKLVLEKGYTLNRMSFFYIFNTVLIHTSTEKIHLGHFFKIYFQIGPV